MLLLPPGADCIGYNSCWNQVSAAPPNAAPPPAAALVTAVALLSLLLLSRACLIHSCLISFLACTTLFSNGGGLGRAGVGFWVQGCRGVSQAQPCQSIWEAAVGGQAGKMITNAEPAAAETIHERGYQTAAVSTQHV